MRNTQVTPARAPGTELDFELGGPAYRIMQHVGVIKGAGPSVGRRSLCFLAITWVPLLILAALEGDAIGPTPRSSLLLDFATYARLFVAVPLIFASESVVGPRLREAGLHFLQGDLVRPESQPAFMAAVERVQRRREAALPEVAFLIIAAFGAWFLTIEALSGVSRQASWGNSETHILPAGLWQHVVVVPLIQFFMFRWLWRWVIWALFLRDVSRLRLNLLATHADMSAGLGFLGIAQVSMAIFPFAMSCVIAAELAFRMTFEGLTLSGLQSMIPLLVAYLVFVELLVFGPLMVFTPLLARTRREGLRAYGMLVQRHNRLFHEKWIESDKAAEESALGNQDMSSLVDLGSSFLVVRGMNIAPISRRMLMQVAVISFLPGVPLVFLALPLTEIVRLFVSAFM
jgi:hypothetical protein